MYRRITNFTKRCDGEWCWFVDVVVVLDDVEGITTSNIIHTSTLQQQLFSSRLWAFDLVFMLILICCNATRSTLDPTTSTKQSTTRTLFHSSTLSKTYYTTVPTYLCLLNSFLCVLLPPHTALLFSHTIYLRLISWINKWIRSKFNFGNHTGRESFTLQQCAGPASSIWIFKKQNDQQKWREIRRSYCSLLFFFIVCVVFVVVCPLLCVE